MTYKFSKRSLERLEGVHPLLQECVMSAMDKQIMDFSIVEGLRTHERQLQLYSSGASLTLKSRHLIQPSGYGHALDIYPYPIDMKKVNANNAVEISRFGMLAGIMLSCAKEMGLRMAWGGDWDSDGQTLDHTLFDAPHFEIEL